jgi:hypothetical protein
MIVSEAEEEKEGRKEVGDGRKKIRRTIEEEDDECRITRKNRCI